MATDPQRMANRTMFSVPPYEASVFQAGQIIPGTVVQLSGGVQYAGHPLNPPQQNPQVGVLEKMLKVETKTLGATQIMIGLIHIGFGAVSLVLFGNYFPLAAVGGYPFWGGLFFIASGSLSVSIENHLNRCLVQSSVGMNITSAVMALTGVILYISELIINALPGGANSISVGLSVLLLLFSLLEFCITVSTAHFGCQAACCNSVPTMVFVPYTVTSNVACDEGNPVPPAYEAVSPK